MSRIANVETTGERQMSLVRVLIADDFDLWKGFVIARLQERRDLQIVGFASDGVQAVQKAEELQPDLILLDMMLPKLNGIEAARQIRKVAPQAKILFVSSEIRPGVGSTSPSSWSGLRVCIKDGGRGRATGWRGSGASRRTVCQSRIGPPQ